MGGLRQIDLFKLERILGLERGRERRERERGREREREREGGERERERERGNCYTNKCG